MFDITSMALAPDYELHLKHPVTGEKLYADKDEKDPVVVMLYGSASKQYRNAVTAMQTRQMRRDQKKEKANAEIINEEGVELLVACSAGSKNLSIEGKAVTSAEDFRKLYSDPKLSWVRAQVDAAIADVGNFLKD